MTGATPGIGAADHAGSRVGAGPELLGARLEEPARVEAEPLEGRPEVRRQLLGGGLELGVVPSVGSDVDPGCRDLGEHLVRRVDRPRRSAT